MLVAAILIPILATILGLISMKLNHDKDLEHITRSDVAAALRADKGPEASLELFDLVRFTSVGDNYISETCKLAVEYTLNDEPKEVSYIVKRHLPHAPAFMKGKLMSTLFKAESYFSNFIVPKLNTELKAIGEPELRVPKEFHSVLIEGRDVIYQEDLSQFGYVMHDRLKPLDKEHTDLVLKEFARLHASSKIMFDKEGVTLSNLEDRYPILVATYKLFKETLANEGMDFFTDSLETIAELTKMMPSYDYVGQYIKEIIPDVTERFERILFPSETFAAICHGDSWNNNILFRYSDSGAPVEMRFVDLQMVGVGSLVNDLEHFLFPSLAASFRQEELGNILTTYHSAFSDIIKRSGGKQKISLDMMKKEFNNNLLYGFLMKTSLLPKFILSKDDIKLLEKSNYDRKVKLELLMKSPQLKSRLLDTFEELRRYGLFRSRQNNPLN